MRIMVRKAACCALLVPFSPFLLQTLGQDKTRTEEAANHHVFERLVKPYDSDDDTQTARSMLAASLSGAGIPGGLVTVTGCEEKPRVRTGRLPEMTLREALDMITVIDPDYRWEMTGGAINFLPANGEPELLKVRIKEIRIVNAVSLKAALNSLMDLPEVREARTRLQLTTAGLPYVGGLAPVTPRTEKYTIKAKDLTFRQALNAVVLADGRAAWGYNEYHCNGKHEVWLRLIYHQR